MNQTKTDIDGNVFRPAFAVQKITYNGKIIANEGDLLWVRYSDHNCDILRWLDGNLSSDEYEGFPIEYVKFVEDLSFDDEVKALKNQILKLVYETFCSGQTVEVSRLESIVHSLFPTVIIR